jgi:hypothetical protein
MYEIMHYVQVLIDGSSLWIPAMADSTAQSNRKFSMNHGNTKIILGAICRNEYATTLQWRFRYTPEIAGVSMPSPMTRPVPSMTITKRKNLAPSRSSTKRRSFEGKSLSTTGFPVTVILLASAEA